MTAPIKGGFRIRCTNTTYHGGLYLVPVVSRPRQIRGPGSTDPCPLCQVWHPVKTIHLWLDNTGRCLVSFAVLEDLKLAGMPELVQEDHVKKPPPLRLGGKATRAAVDYDNRVIRMFGSVKAKKGKKKTHG